MNQLMTKSFLNPWSDNLNSFQKVVDNIVCEAFRALSPRALKQMAELPISSPACDVEETESHFLFSFDMPGINRNDIKVEFQGNQLLVSGERKYEHTEKKPSHRVNECYYGSIQRAFTLPSEIDGEKVEAAYENGVLRLAIPKATSAKNKTVNVGEGKPSTFKEKEALKKVS